jgi:hypothetical protein
MLAQHYDRIAEHITAYVYRQQANWIGKGVSLLPPPLVVSSIG